jgi:U3 small nucleolar RNA-associated protein 19
MPGIVNGLKPGKKRKRKDEEPGLSKKRRRAPKAQEADLQEDILGLEQKILESRTNYNSIHTLLDYIRVEASAGDKDVLAAVALCRVFCRLMAAGNLNKPQDKASNEATIVQWLKGKLQEYEDELLKLLENEDTGRQSTALTLLMRLFKEEATHLGKSDDAIWRDGLFERLLRTMVNDGVAEDTRASFVEKYVEEYDDVRYYTFARLAYVWALLEMNQY